jgi:hypothetical protein
MDTNRLAEMSRVLVFAWERWGKAERALSRAPAKGPRAKAAEALCSFWRGVHNRVETELEKAAAPQRLRHLALARQNAAPTFTRPPDTDLPECFPDLPFPPTGITLPARGSND